MRSLMTGIMPNSRPHHKEKRMQGMKKLIYIALCLGLILLAACSKGGSGSRSLGQTEARVQGKVIALDQNMADVKKAIGEELSCETAPSCMYEGEDKTFLYDGFQILTYPNGEEDFVASIDILSDKVEIASGVKVGDTVETAKEKMQEGELSETEFFLTYNYDDHGLTFHITNGVITEIELFQ